MPAHSEYIMLFNNQKKKINRKSEMLSCPEMPSLCCRCLALSKYGVLNAIAYSFHSMRIAYVFKIPACMDSLFVTHNHFTTAFPYSHYQSTYLAFDLNKHPFSIETHASNISCFIYWKKMTLIYF